MDRPSLAVGRGVLVGAQISEPPRAMNLAERIDRLELRVQQLSDELGAVADSHAKQLTELQLRVG